MKITEILLEPNKVYVNDNFKLKFKVQYTWNDLKENFDYNSLKNMSYQELGGKK